MSGIQGPDGNNPIQLGDMPKQIQTGMNKVYTPRKAPEFVKKLHQWFGDEALKMVVPFAQGMMQMIQNSISRSRAQHEKVQQKIKKRIEEEG